MKKLLFSLLALVLLGGVGAGAYMYLNKPQLTMLPTYFSYSPSELEKLQPLSSKQYITVQDIYDWDDRTLKHLVLTKVQGGEAAKFLAYLTVAQREFAYLSRNTSGEYRGNIAVISKRVMCEFHKDDCQSFIITTEEDAYSRVLADIVFTKIKQRMAEDRQGVRPYPLKEGTDLWSMRDNIEGQDMGSWKPWFLTKGDQYRLPEPYKVGSKEFAEELARVKTTLAATDDAQKQAVIKWSGGTGSKTISGIWLDIADRYLDGKDADLEKVLTVRMALTTGIMDALIAAFDAKYTYLVKRPYMMDASLKTVMPTPNHPSYPSGHSTVGGAASRILTYYLPENAKEWKTLGDECSDSRLWGGIHYLMDAKAGLTLGENVGSYVIQNLK